MSVRRGPSPGLTLNVTAARRLALVRGGLLKPEWTGLPRTAGRGEQAARAAAHTIIDRFGYLQLDTVSVAGARSHALVLLSRLERFPAPLGEALLQPGEPIFEYWGHEASWLPLSLYPVFAFRRKRFRKHPWWGDIIGQHRGLSRDILKRVRQDGPLRSSDLEGKDHGPWWGHKPAKKVVVALWSSGELAIRERRGFQRTYDLAERVIPDALLREKIPQREAVKQLLLRALEGHGWAQAGTLASTWRLQSGEYAIPKVLEELREAGSIVPCAVVQERKRVQGWIRPDDLELAERLRSLRPRPDRGVLLSPFDPVLWDRSRVQLLFGFDQVLEIFKPAPQRKYGYYCLPVLAGETLIGRVDTKADRAAGKLRVLSRSFETTGGPEPATPREAQAMQTALHRYALAVGLRVLQSA